VWFLGLERQRRGVLHGHALISLPEDFSDPKEKYERYIDFKSGVQWWRGEYGMCDIARPESVNGVCVYSAKYAAKEAAVEEKRVHWEAGVYFSDNFPRQSGLPAVHAQPELCGLLGRNRFDPDLAVGGAA